MSAARAQARSPRRSCSSRRSRSRSAGGPNYDFTTSGLIPTACVTSALAIGLLRAAYESMTLELQRLLHVRRRVLLVGDGAHLASLERVLTSSRRAGRVRPRRHVRARARRSARDALGAGAAGRDRPQRGRLRRGDRARARRDCASHRYSGADRTEDDGAAAAARRVRAGAGRAAVRAAAARARRRGLGAEEGVRSRRQRARRRHRPAALAPDRARDQAGLARPRALPRPAHRRRRARVRDAQVPDDGARVRPSSRRYSRSTTRRAARSSRSATIHA